MADDLVFGLSRSGRAVASYRGRALHSAFDPLAEAERFLARADSGQTFILIGPSMGFLEAAIRRNRPSARVLSLQLHPGFRGREALPPSEPWYPDGGMSAEDFLLSRLSPPDLSGLRILSWLPATQAWPAEAADAEEAVRRAIRSLNGSANAINRFGTRWIVNALRNAACVPSFLSAGAAGGGSVIVCASGPSLESALPLLRELQGRLPLCALSSSLRALAAGGIAPDFCVSSDPGAWAGLHLSYLPSGTPLLAPLNACLGSAARSAALLPLDEGSALGGRLLSALGIGGLPLPASGTVSDTALSACLRLGYARVVFVGLDLCAPRIPSHARPGAFDEFAEGNPTRIEPAQSRVYFRETSSHPLRRGGFRSSPQLETYAAHLSRRARSGLPVFRLSPSSLAVPGLADLEADELREEAAAVRTPPPPFARAPADRAAVFREARAYSSWLSMAVGKALRSESLGAEEEEALGEAFFSATLALRKARSGEWPGRLEEAEGRLRSEAERLGERISRFLSARAGE